MKMFALVLVSFGIALISPGISFGTLSGPRYCSVEVNSLGLGIGGEVVLAINCYTAPPINIEYYLPHNSEIVSVTGDANPRIEKLENQLVLKWEMKANGKTSIVVHFKILAPGFHKLYGHITLGDIQEKWLLNYMREVTNKPEHFGKDGRLEPFWQQHLNHPEYEISAFKAAATFNPDAYYISVNTKSVRIETWDFGSSWKRLKHWLKSHGFTKSGLLRYLPR